MNNKNTKFYLDLIIRNGHKGHIKKRKVDIKRLRRRFLEKKIQRPQPISCCPTIVSKIYINNK